MDVDITDPTARQAVPLDEGQGLGVGSGLRRRQIPKPADDFLTLPQVSEGELPDDERMRQDLARLEQFRERPVAGAGDRSRPTYRRGSPRRCPPRRGFEVGLAAAEARKPPRAFPLDERLQRLADDGRLLLEAGDGLGLGQKLVVEGKGRTHRMIASGGTENSIVRCA
jgi:hypothetical protein